MTTSKHSPVVELGKGQSTRYQILDVAADVASAHGLEGLTIGKLATALRMSKSGLYAHFGSKEELQLAVVEMARQRFVAEVEPPAKDAKPGLPKLFALLMSWADSIDNTAYRGGCFFAAASAEFDDRPGTVRSEIARLTKTWIDLLEAEARNARELGHITTSTDVIQLIFEVHAFVQEANWAKQLLDNKQAFKQAKKSIGDGLQRVATARGRKLLPAK